MTTNLFTMNANQVISGSRVKILSHGDSLTNSARATQVHPTDLSRHQAITSPSCVNIQADANSEFDSIFDAAVVVPAHSPTPISEIRDEDWDILLAILAADATAFFQSKDKRTKGKENLRHGCVGCNIVLEPEADLADLFTMLMVNSDLGLYHLCVACDQLRTFKSGNAKRSRYGVRIKYWHSPKCSCGERALYLCFCGACYRCVEPLFSCPCRGQTAAFAICESFAPYAPTVSPITAMNPMKRRHTCIGGGESQVPCQRSRPPQLTLQTDTAMASTNIEESVCYIVESDRESVDEDHLIIGDDLSAGLSLNELSDLCPDI